MTLSWYKSLYWRVALGLIAFLALMLAAEAALFLWTTDRIAGSMPARSPRRLAVLVASDLGTALAADPRLDLEKYVREQMFKNQITSQDFKDAISNSPYTYDLTIDHVQITTDLMQKYGVGKLGSTAPAAKDWVKLDLLEKAKSSLKVK